MMRVLGAGTEGVLGPESCLTQGLVNCTRG